MKNYLSLINNWRTDGKAIALARVIKTWNASPRPVGSALLISETEEMAGSVSGGCVEAAVLKAARDLFETGKARLLDFGVSNDEAWSVGLSCGGRIQVLLELLPAVEDKLWQTLDACLRQDKACVWLRSLPGQPEESFLIQPGKNAETPLQQQALQAYQQGRSQLIETETGHYFAHVFPRNAQLLLIGAAHLSADLIQLAGHFDFATTIIDPRGIFVEKTQFPQAPDHLYNDYPSEVLANYQLDQHCYAVTLSHDPKIDDNALEILLRSPVRYIGALGSRRTHARRVQRLLDKGFSQAEVDRIHGPVGLDIGARRPREIALSIMAQIILVQNQDS